MTLGLPFIYELEDLAIPKSYPYHFKVSANDEVIDFNNIIDWYEQLPNTHRTEIHEYAKSICKLTKKLKAYKHF